MINDTDIHALKIFMINDIDIHALKIHLNSRLHPKVT